MPGLFEQFPHTNLHEINLDWIIDMINQFKKELEDSAVLSVNGQTGHVTLYESENVILPALPEGVDQWRLVRMMNGQNIGILFYNGNVWLQRGNTNMRLLTRDDIPETGVLSWNGMTGAVTANGENIIRSVDDPVSIDQALTTETTERTNQDNAIRNQLSVMSQILADTPQYATQMPMSASDATTVESSIRAINTKLASHPTFKSFQIPANSSITLNITGRSVITAIGADNGRNMYICRVAGGSLAIDELGESSRLTTSITGTELTITSTEGTVVFLYVTVYSGDVTSA